MVYGIENERLKIKVKTLGAELTSIQSVTGELEYLWQGDPAYWSGQSYILFPVIVGLPDNGYQYQGQVYKMKSHGFARNTEFEMVEQTGKSLETLIQEVSSPGGTTIEALAVFDQFDLNDIMDQAVDACAKKSALLSE